MIQQQLFDLSNRTIIVTGSCGLIGRQHALVLAKAGASVVCVDLNIESLTNQVDELNALSEDEKHQYQVCDITNKDAVQDLLKNVLTKYKHIDGLVNNAAINDMFENPQASAEESKFENYPLSTWQKSLDVNITGTFLMTQTIGTHMAQNGVGSIVNIASTYGIVAPDQSLYVQPNGQQDFFKTASYPVTKGAIISFTRFVAAYWGHTGVRVNTLSPGGVENGQQGWFIDNYSRRTPLGRMAKATDYQGALVYLLSDASSYMTGANLVVDGGWTTC